MASTERAFTVSNGVIHYGAALSSYQYRYDACSNLTKLTCSVAGTTWSTTYTYDDDNRPKTTTLSGGTVITNTYDTLGRFTKRTIGLSTPYETRFEYWLNGSNRTTLLHKYYNGSDDPFVYSYDDNGNITAITQGSTSTTYIYDTADRLIRENNGVTNETVTYEYDAFGNLLNRTTYAYTTGTLGTPTGTVNYGYTNTSWGDQLTSYNGQTITYDSMGNPLSYRGYTFTWRGKQLSGAASATQTISFEYNEDGLRQKKTVNGAETDYFYNGSVLIGMQRNGTKYLFSYDASGNVVSVKYNGSAYYYVRNGQGDIIKLIDATGSAVVEYTYNTWGKAATTTGSLAGTLGLIQPFRYRGYVYDFETGFYYLQSRYYDPTTGRFISADVLLSTGQGVLGHNCYAYCLGNPVRYYDTDGTEACGIDIQNVPDNDDPEKDVYTDDEKVGFDNIEDLPTVFLSKSKGRGRETDFRHISDEELADLYKRTRDADLKKKIRKEQKNREESNKQKRKSHKNLPNKRQPNRRYMVEYDTNRFMSAVPALFVVGACITVGYLIAKSGGGGSSCVFCLY